MCGTELTYSYNLAATTVRFEHAHRHVAGPLRIRHRHRGAIRQDGARVEPESALREVANGLDRDFL